MPHVIITGGSSGIGAALAVEHARRGYAISLIARRPEILSATSEMLDARYREAGARIHVEPVDVRDQSGLSIAISRCEAKFGPTDVLITSAGEVRPGEFHKLDAEDFNRQIDINFIGTANTVRAVYPGMIARGSGRILMISSGAGLFGIYGYTAYCASKFALHGFAAALRAEARPHGVDISICFPPDTETPQWASEIALRPVEAKAMGSAGLWKADAVARCAMKGLEQGMFEIFPGLRIGLLGRFGSAARPALNWWFDRAVATTRKK
jgi:short-subunit dehydrogenase